MQLKDVMTPQVEVLSPAATVREAAQKMKALEVGPLPICEGDRVVGMLTDRDITVRAVAEGRDPATTPVSEIMTPDVLYCYEDQDVHEAARLMAEQQVRRVLVLDRDQRLVGIVSLGDLAVYTGEEQLTSEVLEEVSEPAEPKR
jgi:CBS domain-containing protein